jgi:hypothetical protein
MTAPDILTSWNRKKFGGLVSAGNTRCPCNLQKKPTWRCLKHILHHPGNASQGVTGVVRINDKGIPYLQAGGALIDMDFDRDYPEGMAFEMYEKVTVEWVAKRLYQSQWILNWTFGPKVGIEFVWAEKGLCRLFLLRQGLRANGVEDERRAADWLAGTDAWDGRSHGPEPVWAYWQSCLEELGLHESSHVNFLAALVMEEDKSQKLNERLAKEVAGG